VAITKHETKEQIGQETFQFSISATGLISRPFLGSSGIALTFYDLLLLCR
jgi:hypothetical protein